ncbi:MAG: rsbRA 4 [Panacagrimonas sp.]|jgi:rsbT co-antagonist protein RsbR|nr:STAS domain-containing protein [Panacagrimonas sp.]MCC2658816.1 rsbRA 4 [Panacagrimonas sp.]
MLERILKEQRRELLQQWTAQLAQVATGGRISGEELEAQAAELLKYLDEALQTGSADDINQPAWNPARGFLEDLSRKRVLAGFSSDETATFLFSLKRPLFGALRAAAGKDADKLADEIWKATALLDKLGLYTVKAFQRTREEVIGRQQQELLELSTPVVRLWDGILALPLIGTLDSARTQVVMESLLQRLVDDEAQVAIIDITGVPTVDTLVAQHLMKAATAIRLMGAECIISGIRPQIAQTIVHLGVDLGGVTTKATIADALSTALRMTGRTISK